MTHPMDVLAERIIKHTNKRTGLRRYDHLRNIVEDALETMDNDTIYSLCPNPVKIAWLRDNDPRKHGDDWNLWKEYQETIASLLKADTANPWADTIIRHIDNERRERTKRGAA